MAVQAKTIITEEKWTSKSLTLFSPTAVWIFLITLNREKGSINRLLIDSKGMNAYTLSTIGFRSKISNLAKP